MKARIYSSLSQPMFCPACHHKVGLPFGKKQNVNIAGNFTVQCGSCGKGEVTIQIKPAQFVEQDQN